MKPIRVTIDFSDGYSCSFTPEEFAQKFTEFVFGPPPPPEPPPEPPPPCEYCGGTGLLLHGHCPCKLGLEVQKVSWRVQV